MFNMNRKLLGGLQIAFALFVFVILGLAGSAFSQPDAGSETIKLQFKPTINVSRSTGAIKIDGKLDEATWKNAAVANNFIEVGPGDNIAPPVESKALITYDENNLYLAFVAYDNPDEIRASLRERDNIFRDDYFGILFDTYGDLSWSYEIFVNPLGIQGDLRMVSEGGEDGSFDIVFYSEGMITDSGYQVELAIPFASLRFPNNSEQNWRVNFWRDRQRENRNRYSWAAQDRDDPCELCQYGYLTGIKNIRPSSNLEILPNIVSYQTGSLANRSDPNSTFENDDPEAELSLNIRYGISSNSSAELAINPDFSQIESDAGQIDLNNNFGLYFSERRPFFQEGSNLFDTRINVIYTRSINDPDVAGKLTGQFGRTSLAYLVALDNTAPILLPNMEFSLSDQAGNATNNIFRIRRAIGEDSYLGALITDRRLDDWRSIDSSYPSGSLVIDTVDYHGGSGSVYGFDGAFRFLSIYRLSFQAVGSHTEEATPSKLTDKFLYRFDNNRHTMRFDGESFDGHAISVGLSRNARVWGYNLSYSENSPRFRADNGFVNSIDNRTVFFMTNLFFRPNGNWLINWSPSLMLGREWTHSQKFNLDPTSFEGGPVDEWIVPSLYFELKGQTEIRIDYLNSREKYAGHPFEGISRATVRLDSRFSEAVSGGTRYTFGKSIYRSFSNPEMGFIKEASAYVNLKPSQRLFIQIDLDFERMTHRKKYMDANPDSNKVIYSGYILRTRTTYQFTREWYLRLVVQYNDFRERLDIEPLLTWQLNPFSVFYIGMNSNIKSFDKDEYGLNRSQWQQSSRQFFAKFQYLFRI